MLPELFTLWAYWGKREETPQACAARFADMAQRLARIDPVFAQWRQKDYLRGKGSTPFCAIPPDLTLLTGIFNRYRVRKDYPNEVLPEMGMRVSAWNKMEKPHDITIRMRTGAFNDDPNPNYIELDLSEARMAPQGAWSGSVLAQVMKAIAEAWEPRFARVCSRRLNSLLPRDRNKRFIWPHPGWLSYLKPPYSLMVSKPAGVGAESLVDGGAIWTLCEEPFDAAHPRCARRLQGMHEALGPVQAIWEAMEGPIQPWDY